MEERRKHKRLPIKIQLAINEMFRQDYDVLHELDAEVYVVNVSKTGVGLETKSDLPLGYYFDARLDFSDENYFYCVLKIIRKEEQEGYHIFGCEFVGLAEFLKDKVDEYERSLFEDDKE